MSEWRSRGKELGGVLEEKTLPEKNPLSIRVRYLKNNVEASDTTAWAKLLAIEAEDLSSFQELLWWKKRNNLTP